MVYVLTDSKDKKFKVVTSMENINAFLGLSIDQSFEETLWDINHNEQFNNDTVQYNLRKTRVHIFDRDIDALVADVRDIMQGLAVIEIFETEDEGNEEFVPNSYDIVDDDCQSLLV